jgi:hypothetical protein
MLIIDECMSYKGEKAVPGSFYGPCGISPNNVESKNVEAEMSKLKM